MKKQAKTGNILQQNLTFPEKNKILESLKTQIGSKKKVIVAISWGSDSMLTAVLVQNFFIMDKYDTKNLYFVHFNHKIRPESDQEEQFIRNYFKGTNLICIHRHSSLVTRNNTEWDLRTRRYSELKKLVKKYKVSHVILGHNLSDRIESTFLNLLRGAGIKGFTSMQFSKSHHLLSWTKVLRPLINMPKSEIENICKKNHIPYVTDASNYDDTTSLRNKLRNKILPSLYALSKNQKGRETFEQSMLNIYEEIGKTKKKSPSEGDLGGLKSIKQSPYRKAKFAYQRDIPKKWITTENIISLLNQLWIYNNVSSAFLNTLLTFLQTSNSGYKYFQGTYFFVAHGKIYIIQAPTNFWKKIISQSHPNLPISIKSPNLLRYPQPWDRYKGKTRNQYCITQKIPLFRRNFVAVLETDGKINKILKPM